jgi:hypothetical protein
MSLRHRLRNLFSHDKNVDENGEYRVRSLYFDTPGDHALLEKINGFDRREKFRIRMYNGDTSHIRLEKKIKKSTLCAKKNTPLTAEQTKKLLTGDIEWMRDSDTPLLIELYSKMRGKQLRPKTIVEYTREPFIYPAGNVRLTLDRDIRTGLNSTDFLNDEITLMDTFEAFALLEIKYDEFIPDLIVKAARIPDRRKTAFSKYAACRKYG